MNIKRKASLTDLGNQQRKLEIIAWLVWMSLQILVLLAGLFQVRLSANPPTPIESIVLPAMLVVQLVCAVTLANLLLNRPINLFMSLISALILDLFAVLMSGSAVSSMIGATISVLLWLTAIHCLMHTPRKTLQSLYLAILLLLSTAGPVLWYLENEYGNQFRPINRVFSYLSPTLGTLKCLGKTDEILKVGICPTLIVAVSILIKIVWSKNTRQSAILSDATLYPQYK